MVSKERLKVLASDACLSDHFSEANNIRDLQKSYLAFQRVSCSVSSGRWGLWGHWRQCPAEVAAANTGSAVRKDETIMAFPFYS